MLAYRSVQLYCVCSQTIWQSKVYTTFSRRHTLTQQTSTLNRIHAKYTKNRQQTTHEKAKEQTYKQDKHKLTCFTNGNVDNNTKYS